MMKKKIYITGGSGFIGSNLISFFSNDINNHIFNADIHPPDNIEQRIYWHNIDVTNRDILVNSVIAYNPDFLIHLAARTDLNGKSMEEYSVNKEGTVNIIDACRDIANLKHIIFASSMLVCKVGYIPGNFDDYNADTLYGFSKIEVEKVVKDSSLSCSWTIVRPTSIWGPGFKEPYRNFFDIVRMGRFLDIGSKYCTKTYGYIGNSIYQMNQILYSEHSRSKTYYIGDAPPIFISDWAKEIAIEFDKSHPRKIPYGIIKIAAIIGDVLKKFNIHFPMTSFRLRNMTTNNILDLRDLYTIAPNPPYSRSEGVKITAGWIKNKRNI